MGLPAFTRTIHFRISGLFLLMLAIVAGGFWFWLNATIFSPDLAPPRKRTGTRIEAAGRTGHPGRRSWARSLGRRPTGCDGILVRYGERVDQFDAEVIVFDAAGNLASSPDSLMIGRCPGRPLLADMSRRPDWDFSSYPVPTTSTPTRTASSRWTRSWPWPTTPTPALIGYLVASYRPLIIGIEELEGDQRAIGYQALVLILVYAALSGLVIMAWMSRRIRHLSSGVKEFADGNLARRVPDSSADEIGALGGHFNRMAGRLEEMVEELQRKELFQRQLIANISHDLRTPMASLRGYAETLSMQAEKLSAEDRDRYLSIITANLSHLDNLIDHMLTLSRFESGQTVFQMEDFPLGELADSVIMRCETPGRPARGGPGSWTVRSPACPGPGRPLADRPGAAEPGGERHQVHPGGGRGAGGRPTGAGRHPGPGDGQRGRHPGRGPAPRLRALLRGGQEPDRAARTPEHRSVGLGLAIAAKIVAGHGGRTAGRERLGQGTTFRFHLPATRRERRQDPWRRKPLQKRPGSALRTGDPPDPFRSGFPSSSSHSIMNNPG